jgi:hypothetical protein
MIKLGMEKLRSAPAGTRLTEAEYLRQAQAACEHYSIIPGVTGPYQSASLTCGGMRYYYAYGRDESDAPRLVEVFRVGGMGELEALWAFQYPKPFKDLFPRDYAVLYSDDPWEHALSVEVVHG